MITLEELERIWNERSLFQDPILAFTWRDRAKQWKQSRHQHSQKFETAIPQQMLISVLTFSLHLTNECNRNCHCDNLKYTPVCSEMNGVTYYSACHAGCSYVFNSSKVRPQYCTDFSVQFHKCKIWNKVFDKNEKNILVTVITKVVLHPHFFINLTITVYLKQQLLRLLTK